MTPAPGAPQPLEQRRSLASSSYHYALVLAGVGAALTLVPLWAPLLLASWMALVVRPLYARVASRIGSARWVAALATVLLVIAVLVPLVVLGSSLVSEASALIERVRQSGGVREALRALLASESGGGTGRSSAEQFQVNAQQLLRLLSRGGGALTAAGTVLGATTTAVIAVVVFLYGFYTFLVAGQRAHAWLLRHSPLGIHESQQLSRAYIETGRGLLIGVGLTAALQGAVATLGYVIIGVPQPLVFGLLTAFAALVPTLGTSLVWFPLAAGLFVGGQLGQGVAVLVLGCIAASADNFVRPLLSRKAHLELPMFVLFIAMLGGIAMFGPGGLLLGPLLVRLAVEALRLGRARRELGAAASDLA